VMNKLSKIVRRNLSANRRRRRPSWSPVEQPFVELAPEIIDLGAVDDDDDDDDDRGLR